MKKKNSEQIDCISDEEIVSALIQNKTILESSKALGITPKTIYNRLEKNECRSLYEQAKSDILRESVMNVINMTKKATGVIEAVMDDVNTPPVVRVKCATYIISMATELNNKMYETDSRGRKITNPFDGIWENL